VGRKWAQTMRTDELYDRFASVFIFKETPSREKHKTSFGVLTTIELNLQVELTKSCKRRAAYIEFSRFFYKSRTTSSELQATSCELQASSYELQVMSFEIRNMSYELRDTRYKTAPAPADDGTVQPCTVVQLYGAGLYRTLIEFS
jgi:hypothetical protein